MIERFSELKKTTQKGQDNIAFNRWRWTRAQRERERERERGGAGAGAVGDGQIHRLQITVNPGPIMISLD